MANSPLHSAALLVAFALGWKLFVCVVGLVGGLIVAARAWHWLQELVLAWCICSQQHPADFEEL